MIFHIILLIIYFIGYDAFTLDYMVTFPLSLVISRKALTKYQLLFRHLLYLKHVEDLLCKTWMDQKGTLWRKLSGSSEIEKWKFRIFTLRNQMLAFVQQFTYYVTNEVLEPNWRQLETNLTKVIIYKKLLSFNLLIYLFIFHFLCFFFFLGINS